MKALLDFNAYLVHIDKYTDIDILSFAKKNFLSRVLK